LRAALPERSGFYLRLLFVKLFLFWIDNDKKRAEEKKPDENEVEETSLESIGSKLDVLFHKMKGKLFNLNYN